MLFYVHEHHDIVILWRFERRNTPHVASNKTKSIHKSSIKHAGAHRAKA